MRYWLPLAGPCRSCASSGRCSALRSCLSESVSPSHATYTSYNAL